MLPSGPNVTWPESMSWFMNKSQPASSRAVGTDDPSRCDEDEIGALLRHALVEPTSESVVAERWNCLAERIVEDLEVQLAQSGMEIHRVEARRLGLMLRSWSSLTVRLA